MKLFTAAAVAILLSSGMAYAQTSGGGTSTETTGSTAGQQGGTEAEAMSRTVRTTEGTSAWGSPAVRTNSRLDRPICRSGRYTVIVACCTTF